MDFCSLYYTSDYITRILSKLLDWSSNQAVVSTPRVGTDSYLHLMSWPDFAPWP